MGTFRAVVKNRRSRYDLKKSSTLSDGEIKKILEFALLNVPSPFNSQSARMVLFLGEQHDKFWDIVKNTLKKVAPAEAFSKTEEKINGSFRSGYGTVLFFEDTAVIENMQAQFPSYKENFAVWSEHTSAMHQFAVWCMLEESGMGASLQHYNPLIDEEVKKTWGIDLKWRLRAQMPFGGTTGAPGPKTFEPLDKRLKVFN